MLWAMFCLRDFAAGIYVNVTLTCTIYVNIMAMVLPNTSCLHKKDNTPCHAIALPCYHAANIVQGWFEVYGKKFKMLTWFSHSSDLMEANYLKNLNNLLSSCQEPPIVLDDIACCSVTMFLIWTSRLKSHTSMSMPLCTQVSSWIHGLPRLKRNDWSYLCHDFNPTQHLWDELEC